MLCVALHGDLNHASAKPMARLIKVSGSLNPALVMGNHLQDESHKTPERGKQGGLVVPIHLPTQPLPRRKAGVLS